MQFKEKKHFYHAKGFYISCFFGLFAILCAIAVRDQVATQERKGQNFVAELEGNTLEGENTIGKDINNSKVKSKVLENGNPNQEEVGTGVERETKEPVETAKVVERSTQTENMKTDAAIKEKKTEVAKAEEKSNKAVENKKIEEDSEKNVVSVLNPEDKEQGLTWPIEGEVIMKYSMDKSVYFKTLGQYKVNPAMIIQGKEGDKVVSACEGKVEKISNKVETGLTLVIESNGYKFIYGQLKNVSLKKGDIVKEGDCVAKLEKPTRYYKEEGCNLYFEVQEDGKSVNPLLFLK